nr:helix-turn-helix transcriptional regulator [Slackia exigua]
MRKRETVEHVVEHVIAGPVIDEAALARARAEVIAARFPQLSRREREVLELLLQNYSNARIADALSVSENTVKTHVRHIYGRLDLNSRQQLLALAESIPLKETDGQVRPSSS